MPIALDQLPDDVDALKSLVADQLVRNEQLQARVLNLQEQLNLALARRYAASSEKLSPDQIRLFDEAEAESEAAPDRLGRTDLTSAMLADLPTELLQELREATLTLNSEAISAVIERIEPLAPDTAKGLRTLLDDLQMGRLQELLEEVK